MQHTAPTEASTLSLPFVEALSRFSRDLLSRDLAPATQLAYTTDVRQFLTYLQETTVTADSPDKITKADITEYLCRFSSRSPRPYRCGCASLLHLTAWLSPRGERRRYHPVLEREPFAAALLLGPKYHAAADCVLSQ
jgi:hypothetical protein